MRQFIYAEESFCLPVWVHFDKVLLCCSEHLFVNEIRCKQIEFAPYFAPFAQEDIRNYKNLYQIANMEESSKNRSF